MIYKIKLFIKLIRDYIYYKNLDPDDTVLDETERNTYDEMK